MIPENRIPTHPGEILLEEFLRPLGLTKVAFAAHLGLSLQRVNEIVRGKRGVTPEMLIQLLNAMHGAPVPKTIPQYNRMEDTHEEN